MTPKIKKIIFSLLAIISAILLYFYQQIKTYQSIEGKFLVTQVLDGDSFVIPPDQTIRLIDTNAPELDLCYGNQSKQRLEELILNKHVIIKNFNKDKFKRIIGLVYIDENQPSVNQIMLKEGMARYDSSGGQQGKILLASSKIAQENKAGIWSQTCNQTDNIKNPKCDIKGNIGRNNNIKTYHLPNCPEYDRTTVELDIGEQWFCTEKEAIEAGYVKAKNCP